MTSFHDHHTPNAPHSASPWQWRLPAWRLRRRARAKREKRPSWRSRRISPPLRRVAKLFTFSNYAYYFNELQNLRRVTEDFDTIFNTVEILRYLHTYSLSIAIGSIENLRYPP